MMKLERMNLVKMESSYQPAPATCHSERSPFDSLRSLRVNSAESKNLSCLPGRE